MTERSTSNRQARLLSSLEERTKDAPEGRAAEKPVARIVRQAKKTEIAAVIAGKAGEVVRLERELRDPSSEATGAFTEWLLEGAAEVIAKEQEHDAVEPN